MAGSRAERMFMRQKEKYKFQEQQELGELVEKLKNLKITFHKILFCVDLI